MSLADAALACALVLATFAGAQDGAAPEFSASEVAKILRHSPLAPPPPDPTNAFADDPRAAELGQRLFFDARLSANEKLSCASCHVPEKAFADSAPLAEGLQTGRRHTPSLWNVAYQRWLFWDGRSDSLWAQALHPIESERELGGNRLRVAHLVASDPTLRESYELVFGPLPALDDVARFPLDARPVEGDASHPLDVAWRAMAKRDQTAAARVFANLGKSLAAYERRLVSHRAPFDVFAEGLRTGDAAKLGALTPSAQRGLKVFLGKGDCRLCHGGPAFTDGEFHSIGIAPRPGLEEDNGRYGGAELVLADPFNALSAFSDARSGEAADNLRTLARTPQSWGEFRTPSLRNVAVTAPYMHQGQLATLDTVLHYYSTLEGAAPLGHHQEQVLAPRQFTELEQADLRAFLESLTDVEAPRELCAPLPERVRGDSRKTDSGDQG